LAEIAVASERSVDDRRTHTGRLNRVELASGPGWIVEDVVCSCGPRDRAFDEQHESVAVVVVTGGTFQYRGAGSNGRELMTPGALMLGSPGQAFQCGHEHGVGDRCLSFRFTRDYFHTIAAGSPLSDGTLIFKSLRLPPVPALSSVIADAAAAVSGSANISLEEVGIRLAIGAVRTDADIEPDRSAVAPAALARVTRTVRMIEACRDTDLTIAGLAREAKLSPFHFLRTFEKLTGVTPHQYVRRLRLRDAARRLVAEPVTVLDAALDAGFGDLSNFNRVFRAEFGVSPRGYRRRRRN
jgi:AraC-like DNA-binding protein